MFKIIIRHVSITAFGIAIGLLNEWLRNNRTPVLREYAAIIFMTIFLIYITCHRIGLLNANLPLSLQ